MMSGKFPEKFEQTFSVSDSSEKQNLRDSAVKIYLQIVSKPHIELFLRRIPQMYKKSRNESLLFIYAAGR